MAPTPGLCWGRKGLSFLCVWVGRGTGLVGRVGGD